MDENTRARREEFNQLIECLRGMRMAGETPFRDWLTGQVEYCAGEQGQQTGPDTSR